MSDDGGLLDYASLLEPDIYFYPRVTISRFVDADTLDLSIDLGFGVSKQLRCRLARVNAWENRGANRELGQRATNALKNKIGNRRLVAQTIKDEQGKFGRYLLEIFLVCNNSLENLNDWLVREGHATYYYS